MHFQPHGTCSGPSHVPHDDTGFAHAVRGSAGPGTHDPPGKPRHLLHPCSHARGLSEFHVDVGSEPALQLADGPVPRENLDSRKGNAFGDGLGVGQWCSLIFNLVRGGRSDHWFSQCRFVEYLIHDELPIVICPILSVFSSIDVVHVIISACERVINRLQPVLWTKRWGHQW